MKALQFDRFGSPDVIVLHEVPKPEPGPGQIRTAVRACGLTPGDWAVVDGLLADQLPPLPRGLGVEVAGTVDALGEGVIGVEIGDRVFGPAAFDGPTAGAAEYALMAVWAHIPAGVTAEQAAALPMAAETAWHALDDLGVQPGELLLVHGAGSTVGEAAVRLALHRGVRVIATAGPTRAAALGEIGARVTGHGDGMAERVAALAGCPRRPRPGHGPDRRPDRPRPPGQPGRRLAAVPDRADRGPRPRPHRLGLRRRSRAGHPDYPDRDALRPDERVRPAGRRRRSRRIGRPHLHARPDPGSGQAQPVPSARRQAHARPVIGLLD